MTSSHRRAGLVTAALALLLGLNNAFENPARQSFMHELVGPENLRNAVSLNSVLVNVARVIGPALAGLLIATVGEGICFLANAATFVAVVASLATLDRAAISASPASAREPGQLREGLRYVRQTPELGVPLLMMALAGALAYEFQVTLPVMARQGLHVGAERLKVAGQEQVCEHYRLMRDVSHELWYDAQDRLVRQEWLANGHRTVLELVHVGR